MGICAVEFVPWNDAGRNPNIHAVSVRGVGYKCPKTVEIWDALPKSPIGRILRKNLKRRFWSSAERSIG